MELTKNTFDEFTNTGISWIGDRLYRLTIYAIIMGIAVTVGYAQTPETSAQSGALAIKATPPDVDIYINEELHADTTPVVLRLPAGRHDVSIHHHNKRPLHFHVLITPDSVVVKNVTLEDLPPAERTLVNPEELINAQRDSFETEEQFNNRLNRYLEQFNRAASAQDASVQAGVVTLNKNNYDIKNQYFIVTVKWQPWIATLSLPSQGLLPINPDDARRLWQEGTHKPVFVDLAKINNRLFAQDIKLTGLNRTWPLQIRQAQLPPGSIFRDGLRAGFVGPEMVVIPAGRFRMGDLMGEAAQASDNELTPPPTASANPSVYSALATARPVRTVIFDQPFALGRYHVTFDDYDLFAQATGRPLPNDQGWGRGRLPVINVSWDDAQAYTEWLREQTGQPYRLPSEAEWEYAARAGTETNYWWGDDLLPNMANCDNCEGAWAGRRTVPVGSFPANPFGLFEVHGNVSEWVADCWHDHYRGAPVDGRVWDEPDCTRRVWRGGSWSGHANLMRAASRSWGVPTVGRNRIGFRVAQTLISLTPVPVQKRGVTP